MSALVVGGGLAGTEAAWQLAERGCGVTLVEMRPTATTAAHTGGGLAEMVCSNSLRGDSLRNAVGLLKREMEELGSLVLTAARATAVPAGGALAVDRGRFQAFVEDRIHRHPGIRVERREVTELPEAPAIIATGPLTSAALHRALDACLGEERLAFYDAIAPIVAADSLDHRVLYPASRYGKGDGADYLNAPFDRDQYDDFIAQLTAAECVPLKDFEGDVRFFEGCLPVEEMAARGHDTLRFGPMKPVGLEDPRTGRRPWAVVQLRRDDLDGEAWNLVGFQTKLTYAEQKRVFRLIPGLGEARFVRLGSVHRNTFINAPHHLDGQLRLRARPHLRLAGQITGVEGYVESAAVGLYAGLSLASELSGGGDLPTPPGATALAGLLRHLGQRSATTFQPSNITWGLMALPDEVRRVRGRGPRREAHAELALEQLRGWRDGLGRAPEPAPAAHPPPGP